MKNENYINIQGWMINNLKLQGNELVLYAIIYGFSQDGESEYRGSLRYIERSLRVSRNTVISNIKKLSEKGLITCRKSKEGNYYSVSGAETEPLKKGGAETEPQVVQNVNHGGAETEPVGGAETEPNNNNTNNKYNNNNSYSENAQNHSDILEISENEPSSLPDVLEEKEKSSAKKEKTPREESTEFFEDSNIQTAVAQFLSEKNEIDIDLAIQEIKSFVGYWTERTPNGKKQKWQKQETFEVKRRLTTWFSRNKNFKGNFDNSKKWYEESAVGQGI